METLEEEDQQQGHDDDSSMGYQSDEDDEEQGAKVTPTSAKKPRPTLQRATTFSSLSRDDEDKVYINDSVRGFFRDYMVHQKSDRRLMSKSDFDVLMFEKVGTQISKNVLDENFNKCDVDNNGLIGPEQLAQFITNIKANTKCKRICKVTLTVVKSTTFWASVAFLAGSTLSATINLLNRRRYVGWEIMSPSETINWLFTVGCTVFVQNSIKRHAEEFDLYQKGNAAMHAWFQQCPLFQAVYPEESGGEVSFVMTVDGTNDEVSYIHYQSEDESESDDGSVVSLREGHSEDSSAASCRPRESQTLKEGAAAKLERILSGRERYSQNRGRAKSSRRVVRYSKFSSSLLAKIVSDTGINVCDLKKILERESHFVPDHILEEIFHKINNGDGSGTVTMKALREFIDKGSTQEISKRDCYLAIAKRCARSFEFWANWVWLLGSFLFVAAVYLVKAGASEADSEVVKQLYGFGSIMYFLGGVNLLPTVYNDVYQYLSYRQELRRAFSNLNYERRRSSILRNTVNPFGNIPIKETFSDVLKTTEEKVGFFELYDQLLDSGVVFPFEVFHSMYAEADARLGQKGNPLKLEDFTDYLASIEEDSSTTQRHIKTIKILPTKVSFWTTLVMTVAGLLFTLATYVDCGGTCQANMSLMGSLFYASTTAYSLTNTVMNTYFHSFHVEMSRLKLKSAILDEKPASGNTFRMESADSA